VQSIVGGCEQVLPIVEEVRRFLRPDIPGHLRAQQRFDVRRVIRTACALVGRLADTERISIRIQLPRHRLLGIGDEQRLIEVLLNFLTNALKFSPHGAVVVVSAERRPAGKIRIAVTDEGEGLSPSQAGT
jgi:signal transduction histidine kinase